MFGTPGAVAVLWSVEVESKMTYRRATVYLNRWADIAIMSFIIMLVSLGQAVADPGDGYAIITSRDTILGQHQCHARCDVDADCPDQQRCITVDDLGSMCLAGRAEDPAPTGWSGCEADMVCAVETVCIRKAAPQQIQAFVDHKRGRGFDVHLVDETVWGGGDGDGAADNIRAWLQANYIGLNLRYVLLIGDPRTTGDVPMRGTRPANNAHQDWADNPTVFTDFYFAELDGNWDLDGDGLLGEYVADVARIQDGSPASMHRDSLADDMGQGGANRDAEVAVGRIPFYGDVDALDHILIKTMAYENAPADSIAWRRSALLAAEGQHRAFFGELIRTEILEPNDFASYRIYDVHDCWDDELNEDVECRSPIDGVPEFLHCNPANVGVGLTESTPGFVSWLTHGSGRGAQAVMNLGDARALVDERPFFTFQASCSNAQPTVTENLAYELLKNGAIGTVAATTISHGPGAPMPSLRFDAGNAGMAYNFAQRLITEGMTAGEALADLRRDVDVSNRWWYWKNYLTFNLWGDPSLGLDSHAQLIEPIPVDAGAEPDPIDGGLLSDAADMTVSSADAGVTNVDMAGVETDSAALIDSAIDAIADAHEPISDGGIGDARPNTGAMDASMDSDQTSNSSSQGCMSVPGLGNRSPMGLLVCLVCGFYLLRRRRFWRRYT